MIAFTRFFFIALLLGNTEVEATLTKRPITARPNLTLAPNPITNTVAVPAGIAAVSSPSTPQQQPASPPSATRHLGSAEDPPYLLWTGPLLRRRVSVSDSEIKSHDFR